MIMKRAICLILITAFIAVLLTACGENEEIITNVKFSVYESNGSDMISFYTTSEAEINGKWDYSLDNGQILTVFHDTESEQEFGSLFEKKTASYRTIILKPVAEGEAFISFKTSKGESEYSFKLTVTKDKNGVLRIKGESTTK